MADVWPENDLLEKAAIIKKIEYLPLGEKLKAKTDIAKKQYKKLDDNFEFHKIAKKEKATLENYNKSDLICNSNYSFYKYCRDMKKFDHLSLKSKHSFLANFFDDLGRWFS